MGGTLDGEASQHTYEPIAYEPIRYEPIKYEPGGVMSVGQPGGSSPRSGTGIAVAGTLVLALVGVGWFLLSHTVMGTETVDAAGEAAGVVLGLLILISAVGAVTSSRRRDR